MKRLLTAALALGASAFLFGCGDSAANNSNAAKPANTSNTAANSTKPAAVDTAAIEADLKKFLSDFEAALNKNDADAIGKFYDDTYTLIDQNGEMQTKASRMEQIKSGKVKWDGLKFSDVKFRVHPAGDGAVMYARATGKTMVDGKTEERNSMVTWVARKMPDGWKFIHAQITDVKGGAAAKPADEKQESKAGEPANK